MKFIRAYRAVVESVNEACEILGTFPIANNKVNKKSPLNNVENEANKISAMMKNTPSTKCIEYF